MAHARLGPSNTRWPHCPGSVREEAAYPDVPGAAAIDGTGTHLLLEMCLDQERVPDSFDGEIIGANHPDNPSGWLVAKDRIDRVAMCLAYLERRRTELLVKYPKCHVITESEGRVNPGALFGRTDWWGTCDITLTVRDFNGACLFVEVIDYKDGRGWVDVKDNSQLLSYAAGRLRHFIGSGPELVRPFQLDKVVDGVRCTVVQPKTNPMVRYQDYTTEELMGHVELLARAAHATDWEDAPLTPDNKGGKGYCRWCKHRPNCDALARISMDTIKEFTTGDVVVAGSGGTLIEVIEQTFGDITKLESDKLAQLADIKPGIDALFARVNEEIERRLLAEIDVPGYTIEPGRGSNVWNDSEENIVKMLKARKFKQADIYPPKLISPAQVLKSDKLTSDQKAKIEKEYIAYKAGNPSVKKVAYQKPKEKDLSIFNDIAQPTKLSFL